MSIPFHGKSQASRGWVPALVAVGLLAAGCERRPSTPPAPKATEASARVAAPAAPAMPAPTFSKAAA